MTEILDKVLNLSKITFLRDLTLDESLGLLEYITIKLPGKVRGGNYSQFFNMDYPGKGMGVRKDEGTVKITGTLVHNLEPMAFDSFKFEHSNQDTSRLSSLQFDLMPEENELVDYRQEVIQLWKDVRSIIMDYFNDNPE